MKGLGILIKHNLKVIFNKKANIVVYIILPILVSVFFLSITGNVYDAKIKLGIVNNDNGSISQDMIAYMKDKNKFSLTKITEQEGKDKVASGNLDLLYIIPQGFTEGVYKGNIKTIKIKAIKGAEVTGWIENYTKLYIENLLIISKASSNSKATFDKIYKGYRQGNLKVEETMLEDKSSGKGGIRGAIGALVMFMFMSSSNISDMILKEKQDRTLGRICTTPVKNKTFLFSNIIVNFIVMFMQISSVLFIITFILRYKFYISMIYLYVILVCLGVAAVALGLVITTFANSTSASSTIKNLIITPTCMLGGCFWPIDMMPKFLRRVSDFVPQKWAIDAISKLSNGEGFSSIIVNLFIILGFSVILFLVSIYKMKRNDNVSNFV